MPEALRKKIRIPLYPEDSGRIGFYPSLYSTDARYENCYVDIRENPMTKERVSYIVKRPGTSLVASFTNTLNASDVDEFETQGMWVFHGVVYFVNNNNLYYRTTEADEGTLLYTFNADTIFTTSTVKIWEEFGTDFIVDFEYRAVSVFNDGVEQLYITNGFEDVLLNKDSTVTSPIQAFNAFVASSSYKPGDKVIPSTYALRTGYYYIAIGEAGVVSVAGTEPTWPTTVGDTVTSGDVTFMCFSACTSATVAERYTNRVYALNDLVTPATETGFFYKCTTAGTTTWEPTWTQIKGDTATQNSVVFECMGYYGGKPGLALPAPVYLDTYIVLNPYKSSDLYNSDAADVVSWNASNFISADSFTSPAKAITRYNNYILVFSEADAELFFDNANTTGSPFSRHESFLLQVGAVSQSTVVTAESFVIWVGMTTSGQGCVWMLDGFQPKEISTPWINRAIADTNTYPLSGSSYPMRVAGHLFVVLNLTSSTFVYDVGMNLWYHWGVSGALLDDGRVLGISKFPFDYFAFDTSVASSYEGHFMMSKSTKELFSFTWFATQDALDADNLTAPIRLQIITPLIDMGNRNRKFCHSIDIIGDKLENDNDQAPTEEGSLLEVSWSDDDYSGLTPIDQSEPTLRYVDLRGRPRITPVGNFRRRAFKLVYQGIYRIRLEALDFVFTQGSS